LYIDTKLQEYDKDKWEETKELLFGYISKYHRVPSSRGSFHGYNIGKWYSRQKDHIKSITDPLYIKLSINPIIEKDINALLMKREANKGIVKLSWSEIYDLLTKYIIDNGNVPTQKVVYHGIKIGRWLNTQKCSIQSTSDDLYHKLSLNPVIKKDINTTLEKKMRKLSWDKWYDLLRKYVEEYGNLPVAIQEYHGYKIGSWYRSQKTRKLKLSNDSIYIKLCEIPMVKEDLDKYLSK
jgi:hypothetical protein